MKDMVALLPPIPLVFHLTEVVCFPGFTMKTLNSCFISTGARTLMLAHRESSLYCKFDQENYSVGFNMY